MKKEFAVIGLGRFGGSIVQYLSAHDYDVLAIDIDEERVSQFMNIASYAVVVDAMDELALKSLGIRNFDHVIVAIGENLNASILTTIILKELGVKNITVKAQSIYHEKILQKIGATQVVHPERDMGKRIAKQLISNNVFDYLDLSEEYSIMELIATDKIANKNLIDLNVRANYDLNIIGIKRDNQMNVSPIPTEKLRKGDLIFVIGHNDKIEAFQKREF
ncbi:MAG TPA: TrkA family potassium uptake protein [Firmicutes bacterium]|nr:TrkA family potassium uptake protein [Bacillales bacterium]HJA42137.1 TrkA family potassium uptake protein [Bacillota bacterium]